MQPLEMSSRTFASIAQRTEALFAEHWRQVCKRADHLFAGLLIFQWLAGIAAAYWISPKTWVGQTSYTHIHIWAALLLGGAIISLPIFLALTWPGTTLTRHVIAVAQMLMSGLLIHLTGGRIETHFHVFGSLALLAFYRDWRVLISATAVVALDHLIRGVYFPQSVFGVLTASPWRWLEHAGWVVFEDIFLIPSCVQSIREMRGVAEQQARLEATNESIEAEVLKRTAELGESQARNAAILESALDCIITFDAEGRIIEFNPAAEKTFGYPRAEALGKELTELLVSASSRATHQGMEPHPVTGENAILGKRSEVVAMRADGSEFPVELAITPVGQVEPPMFTAYLQDIAERKRAEKEWRKAKEAAESASRAKSEFLASMSHEIRTPMNGVIGMTGLLLDTSLTDEQREFAEIVQSSADALLTIINDILDFSKIEAGKLTIEPVPFDLRQVIEEVAEILATKVEAKGLDLILRYDPAAPHHLVGDTGRLRQVLTNLAGNAVKFTHTGHIFINVECEKQTDAETSLRISVEDTGIGIPEEKLDHIFEKFTQADASTTRQYGGTGLGLAICTQLIELMGGEIGVNSSPGNGSTFWFKLCLPRHSEPLAPVPAMTSLRGVRVLIVDDNQINRRVLHEQISNWGMRNGGFASGPEALVALRAAQAADDPYQIAILDYQMPEMDGEMLARAIKADPLLQETMLVMLTSIGQLGEAERMKEAGFAAHLVKPARQTQLMDALTKAWGAWLEMRSAEWPICQTPTETPAATPGLPAAINQSIRAQVLVAEDNIINQKVAVRLLKKFGCHVDIAANGKEAIEMSEAFAYDIIFMDCQMPEMDGYKATAEIRRREGYTRHIPIIAMTAHALKGDREHCLEAGMDDYITKPVKTEDFQQMLQQWVMPIMQEPEAANQPREDQPSPSVVFDDEAMAHFYELAEQLDVSFVSEILKLFLDTAPAGIAAVRQAASAGDARGLMETAHAFKGSCSNLALRRMVTIAQELEGIGRAQSVTDAGPLIDQLEHEFDRARVEIETRLQPTFACLV
jgi:two-component system, sensor histidine kinase and response regulator